MIKLIVFVKYLGYFSQIIGKREEKVSLDKGATVEVLLQNLAKKYGRKFEEAVASRAFRSAVILVNGEQADMKRKLNHGDNVVISFPMGGGSLRVCPRN
ncbi:MoaD family protein [Ferroglobus placidus DSM 10642]|uniref:MoaD family protein n=1 Tax=Ferroglobus placidus (strain DSM 10642 / AEDII12DO) TaxID=589924 RepID=D3S1J2_FERPA|nr:MoaD family protein [Ferroglobus placidus]ADC66456.1 MoaD family protein [Ferroglobus placidus DSM 10642]